MRRFCLEWRCLLVLIVDNDSQKFFLTSVKYYPQLVHCSNQCSVAIALHHVTWIFVSTKFHFDETISLAGLVSSFVVVVCPTFMGTLRWANFCNFGATLLRFGTLFTNIILLWIRNSEKNWTTPTSQKNQKTPKKDLSIF